MADPGRRLSPNLAAALVLVALGAALLVWQHPWHGDPAGDRRPRIPADAAAVLARQFDALSSAESASDFAAAAGPGSSARAFARAAWSARDVLGAADVTLRYVSGGEVADRADGSSEATVEVGWRSSGASGLGAGARRTSSVRFRVVPTDDGRFSVTRARAGEGPLPLWLGGSVELRRQRGAVVIRVDGGDSTLPVETMAATARRTVSGVVPGTHGDVTVVSPHSQAQMAQLVGQDVAAVGQIAAVTTRLDVRGGATGTGTVIVLNPAVYSTMDRRAGQVVLSHEATHLLTGAVGTTAQGWVVEGFADFVALHDDTAPLSVSAGQVLRQVRDGDAPTRLPTSADFGSTRHGLGAVYEGAWMAFRLLGERFGDADVDAFYADVLRGTSTDRALESAFGIDERQLTAQWRAYLTKSASTVS